MNDDNSYEESPSDSDALSPSTIEPSFSALKDAVIARLTFHMASTDMDESLVLSLAEVFAQRIEAKMIRLRDGQAKHGGDFLNDVDHRAERRQEIDDSEWYDMADILKTNTSITLKL